jgi:uncharacterized integral membrane protein
VKINFGLLAKASWEILKFPLLMILTTVTVTLGTLALFYCFGKIAFPILIILLIMSLFGFLISMRYKELMVAHKKEQQNLVDILSR